MRDQPTSPSQLNPAVPADISALVLRALEKDPARRTPSAGVFREEIEAAMAHHRLSSSPLSVAQFLKDTLGQWLADFTPTSSGDHSGDAFPRSSTSLPPVQPRRPEPAVDAHLQRTQVALPLSEVQPARAAAHPWPDPVPASKPRSSTSNPPVSRSARSTPAYEGEAPPPTVVSGSRAKNTPNRTSSTSQKSLPPVPRASSGSGSHSPARRLPAARPPPSEPVPEPDTESRSRPRSYAVMAAVALLVIAGGAMVALAASKGKHVQVVNLQSGENLYVRGLRVDPSQLEPEPDVTVPVATASKLTIRRYGNAPLTGRLDLGGLVDASPDMRERLDAKAKVTVRSDPTGCDVFVDGRAHASTTPAGIEIQAGKETLVEVSCQGRPARWSQWVLGVVNQNIEVRADLVQR